MEDINRLIELLRLQRHDFMNELQIIYGFIQVGKIENAENHIKKLCYENEIISKLYSLGDDKLAFTFESNIKNLLRSNINIDINLEINILHKKLFDFNFYKKNNLVNNIFKEFEKVSPVVVYIYIFEDDLGFNIVLFNHENIIDELNWNDSWKEINSGIEDIRLMLCKYDEYLSYRMIFN